MRISDWSSDVCSSDFELGGSGLGPRGRDLARLRRPARRFTRDLVHSPSGLHRFRPFLQNIRIILRPGGVIVALDEQPVVGIFALLWLQADRSEGRRVGKEWVSTGGFRGWRVS